MRRRSAVECSTPLRLRRYVAEEWNSPQDWCEARRVFTSATGRFPDVDPDTAWPDVPLAPEDV